MNRALTYDGVRIFALALWMALVSPDRAAAITKHQAALSQPGRILLAHAREQPDSVRDALSREFTAMALASSDRQRLVHLQRASPFPPTHTAVCQILSSCCRINSRRCTAQRTDRGVARDSLRRSGTSNGNESADAMTLWRESFACEIAVDPRRLPSDASIGPAIYASRSWTARSY